MADHAGTAADVPLSDRAAARGRKRLLHVLRADMEAVDVVQPAVPGLGDDRQIPGLGELAALDRGGHEGVAHDADAVGVRDRDGTREQAELAHELEPGHLAVAVEPVGRREEREVVEEHHRHARAHVVARDERGVADADAGDVGDRVERAGLQVADGDPELARSHERISSSTSSRLRSISSSESASRLSRRSGSVFDGRTLKCQSS